MVVGLVAGSFLGFGVYSAQIRKNGRFTATESHTLGIIMDLGGSPTHPFFLSLSLSRFSLLGAAATVRNADQ